MDEKLKKHIKRFMEILVEDTERGESPNNLLASASGWFHEYPELSHMMWELCTICWKYIEERELRVIRETLARIEE